MRKFEALKIGGVQREEKKDVFISLFLFFLFFHYSSSYYSSLHFKDDLR